MTIPIQKALRLLSQQWGEMLDQRTELQELILPPEVESTINKLVKEMQLETLKASERAKKVAEKLKQDGKPVGRPMVITPAGMFLRRMLVGKSISKLAKELNVSRATIRKRLNG